jgi:hypothetical protein
MVSTVWRNILPSSSRLKCIRWGIGYVYLGRLQYNVTCPSSYTLSYSSDTSVPNCLQDRTVSEPRRSNMNNNCHEDLNTYFTQKCLYPPSQVMQFSFHIAVDKMMGSWDNVIAVLVSSDKYYLLKNVCWSNPKVHWLFAFNIKRSHCWKKFSITSICIYLCSLTWKFFSVSESHAWVVLCMHSCKFS